MRLGSNAVAPKMLELSGLALLCLTIIICVRSEPVDVALNKPITADLTCGISGPESFFNHSQIQQNPADRIEASCEDTNTHPANNMVDGRLDTWWQSTARNILVGQGYGVQGRPQAVLNIDLQQTFEIKEILLEMGDSKRPEIIIIYKSEEEDVGEYRPWVYRVTDENDCTQVYRVPVVASPASVSAAICQTYAKEAAESKFEMIDFDFNHIEGRLAAWRFARHIKIEFYEMDLTLGILGGRFQHFTVRRLEVKAECFCYGHHTGCDKSEITGQYECVCGGNTDGEYCQQCQPFYNQQPFQYEIPCEACNCHSHSDVCHYDPDIANLTLSLNADGDKVGGGVCDNCLHNTTGVNCEKCVDYYHRPIDRAQTDPDACIPCSCQGAGVRVNRVTGLVGDCVMNEESAPPGMVPGACLCKENVEGLKCDNCKPGYFNLQEDNLDGCQPCFCDPRGSVQGSVCEVNSTGQCPCKNFVMNRQCDECMDEYYGLSVNNTQDGCLPCECDVGGAFNNLCSKSTGQCSCRDNIGGRQCKQPLTDFYYPDLHFISAEFEKLEGSAPFGREQAGYMGFGYAIVSDVAGITELYIPRTSDFSGLFSVLLRYMSDEEAVAPVVLRENGREKGVQVVFPPCPVNWCNLLVEQEFELRIGETYEVSLSSSAEIKLDRIVALPEEFTNATLLGVDSETFAATCDVVGNDMRLGSNDEDFCLAQVFSLTTRNLDGALACDCHSLGSYNNESCAVYGGQCLCKPGVGGRRCDQCLLEYYDLSVTGCRACECVADDKICDRFTGQCDCPENTVGRQCDRCRVNHWGWNSTTGCQDCQCNPTGSAHMQCNLTTGVCDCKTGVTNDKCDECRDTFKDFSYAGCRMCNCDASGSQVLVCDKETGQCPCKNNTEGLYCSRCKDGSFYLAEHHEYGCLNCVCMGVTDNCDSTPWDNTEYTLPISTENNDPLVTLVTEDAPELAPVTVVTDAELNISMADIRITGSETYYLKLNDGPTGNLLGLFENNFKFTVRYTVIGTPDPAGEAVQPVLMLVGHGGQRFKIATDPVVAGEVTEVSVMVTDANVVAEEGGSRRTREELVLALSNVQEVWLPATFYNNRPHTIRIGSVKYELATQRGRLGSAHGVEQCNCGAGYQGLSCETCSFGYMRDNSTLMGHEYLGECTTCECNNHADFCNPDTMQCQDCLYQTTGFHCDICEDGTYGDATRGTPFDCSPCPCYAPRVDQSTCELVDGRAQCLYCSEGYTGALCDKCDQFYFGDPHVLRTGTCQQCDCNGNSVDCDAVTGECVSCDFNTTGLYCERCADGYFGDASAQGCQPCDCVESGSIQLVCNHTDGQCECQSGVGERTCSACQTDYYGLSNTSFIGCIPCLCNEFGSAITQCDDTGLCECANNTAGTKCDQCETGFYGLPHRTCADCDCDRIGSVDEPCERVEGQCECKPGVAGRRCDTCQRMYVEFGTDGCKKCDRCQYALGNDTLLLKEQWEVYWNRTSDIRDVQSEDPTLQALADELNATSASLGVSEDRLEELTDSVNTLVAREKQYNDTVDELMLSVSEISIVTERLENQSIAEMARLTSLQSDANQAWNNVVSQNTSAQALIQELQANNVSAYGLLSLGTGIYKDLNMTFEEEMAAVTAELIQAQNISVESRKMAVRVDQQGNLTTALDLELVEAEKKLDDFNLEITRVNSKIADVDAFADSVAEKLRVAQENKAYAEGLIAEAKSTLALTEAMVTRNDENYDEAEQLFQDCVTIIEGIAGQEELPVTSSMDLTGVIGWMQSEATLRDSIDDIETSLVDYRNTVTMVEEQAAELTLQAQSLQTEYRRVEELGERAVEAIQNYKEVVVKLDESLQTALEANKTMMEANLALQDVSADQLSAEAAQSKADSITQRNEVETWGNVPSDLLPRLEAANASLLSAVDTWDNLEDTLTRFYASVDETVALAADPGVDPDLTDARRLADQVIARAGNLQDDYNDLQPEVNAQADVVAVIEVKTENASVLLTEVDQGLTSFQNQLETDVQRPLDLLNQDLVRTNSTRNTLDDKMAALEAKLALARQRLLALEQPVNYGIDDYSVMDNPDAEKENLLFNEIQLDFSYSLRAQGVLFFVENPNTDEKMLLQIVDEYLVFEYANSDTTTRAVSPAVLCAGCWFRVTATRYDIDIQLTVQKLSTGGVAVTHMRGTSTTDGYLTLSSDLYMGGLPPEFTSSKVDGQSTEFIGCLYQVMFGGYDIPLWQTIFDTQSSVECCAKPPDTTRPVYIDAVTVHGFGFLQVDPVSFSVVGHSHASLQFRTFSPSGALLTVDKVGSGAKYTVLLDDGQVRFEIWPVVGRVVTLGTDDSTYNDGQWYQVTVRHNSTYAMLTVEFVDKSVSARVDVKSVFGQDIDLSALEEGSLTFGGLNPETSPSTERQAPNFAGCLQNFEHSIDETLTLVPRELAEDVVLSEGIDLHQCYSEVIPGLGFSSSSAYARLGDMESFMSKVSFNFQTYQPHGVLLYAELSTAGNNAPQSMFLYVTLYHGDIFVLFNEGSGLQGPLRSRGLYLGDGQSHAISLDFRYQNSPRLTVNGAIHYGALTMTPNMRLRNQRMWTGGIPDDLTLTSDELPVTQSLIGGISDLQVNDEAINYYNLDVVRSAWQQDLYLSGLPIPETEAPPVPYTTTPAPPTPPAPTCAPPTEFITADMGLRFGDTTISYAAYETAADVFKNAFTLDLEFRTVSPDGLLVYMAETTASNPTDYFVAFMEDGYITLSMQSDTTFSRQAKSATKLLRSKRRYNDGQWWELSALRINDFMAVIVEDANKDNRDYRNNKAPSNLVSNLNIQTNLYLGGVPRSFGGLPFTSDADIPIGKTSFHGCIREVSFASHNDPVVLDLRIFTVDCHTVNGAIHYGALTMTPNMRLRNQRMWTGGIPDDLTLTSDELPVTQSLIGGISDLQVNDEAINYYNLDVVRSAWQQDLYLSGLPIPETEAPPVPYTTTPAPPTPPAPTCAPPTEFITADMGLRFGDTTISYAAYETAADVFKNAFTLDLEFRTVSPDGLLVYMAETTASNPTDYFVAFMEDGYITLSMQSDTTFSRQAKSATKLLRSKRRYNDGQWWELSALRINDFMAVIVEDANKDNRDYRNNKAPSNLVSNLNIQTNLYLGGVPRSFGGLPFTSDADIPIGKTSFHGCIREVSFASHNDPVVLDLSQSTVADGTNACFNSIEKGTYLDGVDSYARVLDDDTSLFNIRSGFHMSLTFKGNGQNGTLMSAWKFRSSFVMLDLYDGLLRAIVANAEGSSSPLIVFTQSTINNVHILCDGQPHTIIFQVKSKRIALTLDDQAEETFDFPIGYSFPAMGNMEIYVGGMRDYTVEVPAQVSKQSFRGCVLDVEVAHQEYQLVDSTQKRGLMSGCPG